jgi:predicted ATPase
MSASAIRTPDQRLRVFVSSTLGELAEERRAVRAAVEQLRLTPIMFELGARPHPPRTLYRAYLEQSHVFVAVYWQSYGWVAPDMEISGLEDELVLSTGIPRLIYVKRPAPDMQPRLESMLGRLRNEESVSYKAFADAEELHRLVLDDLSLLLVEGFTGSRPATAETVGPSALPVPTTSFVGREQALSDLCTLLRRTSSRLVTLVGPGGTGKTRLALEAASRVSTDFPHGTVMVDLSAELDPEKVPAAIVRAVGSVASADEPPLQALERGLRDARMLLVLDNFEQVAAAAPQVSELVQSCTRLTVFVTSRESLRVRGESVVHVPPLELPPETAVSPDAALHAPAVQLFVDRAADAAPGFELDADNIAHVVTICRRLDGLPLAIELAAARLRLFAVEELRTRLDQSLDELRGGARDLPERHQALRQTIEWSVGLLSEDERDVLAALSVFGGAHLRDVEAVLGQVPRLTGVDVVECVASLLDKSLVHSVPAASGGPRFAMLETIRAYAGDLLGARPDLAPTVQDRHARHYQSLARAQRVGVEPARRDEALAVLADEHGNLRTAWSFWVRQGDVTGLNDLLEVLWGYYDARGAYREAVSLGEDLVSVLSRLPPSAARTRDEIAMQASLARSMIAVRGYDAEVERTIRVALARVDDTGDEESPRRFPVLRALGTLHLLRADLPRCRAVSDELLGIARGLDDPALLADAHQLAGITQMGVDLDHGLHHLDRSIDYFEASAPPRIQFRIGPNPGVVSHVVSGLMLWMRGYPERARWRVERGLELADLLGHPYTRAYALFHASLLALWRSDLEQLRANAVELRRVADAHDYPIWRALSLVLAGTARIGGGEEEDGLAELERGFALYGDLETPPIFWSGLLTIRAAAFLRVGRLEEATRHLEDATAALWEGAPEAADIEILRGDLLLSRPDPDPAAAATRFELAATIARERGTGMSLLQALTRLAVLRRGTAREHEARSRLREVVGGFSEGHDTPPLVQAQRVLDGRAGVSRV